MKILAVQMNPTIGDFAGNARKIARSLASARSQNADLVLFPELALCGYPPEDLLLHDTFIQANEKALQEVITLSQGLTVVLGLVRSNPGGEKSLFNSAAIIQEGKLLGFYDKRLLPTYDVFDERRYFDPGTHLPPLWEVKGKKVAVLICEDMWQHAGPEYVRYTRYAQDPVAQLIPLKPDLVVNLSASPYHYQKPAMRIRVCQATVKTLKCPFVLCCLVGGNDQLVFDGYSAYLGADGQLRALASGFEEEELLIDLNQDTPPHPFSYDENGDLYRALVLGVRDYFSKQGFKRACIGISGGIDSALVACIAVDALGKESVLGVAMPSRYNSPESLKDAERLAQHLGIELKTIPIEGPFTTYLDLLAPDFAGKPQDLTEENLQSRIRGAILMALSNKFRSLVLSTGNKSELALGYCTLYGDMVGGLAVISDVTKKQVYELADWINQKGERIPRSIIDKPPSAELRPNQKDTDTLPEYPVIDAVVQGYVEEHLSPETIAQKNQLSLAVVTDLIHKIHLAEYKRRQAAPGLRVTRRAFQVGRHYPIVQKWQ